MDTNANASTTYKYLFMVCVHYGWEASTYTKDIMSMRTGCSSSLNLTKRDSVLVPTKSCLAHNYEVTAKESVHCRKNLRLDGEDMAQANVMLAELPQTGEMCEALVVSRFLRGLDLTSTPFISSNINAFKGACRRLGQKWAKAAVQIVTILSVLRKMTR